LKPHKFRRRCSSIEGTGKILEEGLTCRRTPGKPSCAASYYSGSSSFFDAEKRMLIPSWLNPKREQAGMPSLVECTDVHIIPSGLVGQYGSANERQLNHHGGWQ
jgi:hypothetical protein